MKKLFFLGALFAVGLGFTACSSDKDEVAQPVNPDAVGGEQYLAVGINLPQDPASTTRAATTDNDGNVIYNDGLPSEYAVKNAMLILFDDASTEDEAQFVGAYSLSTTPWTTTSASNNVTEYSKKVIAKVTGVQEDYRVLVVLNKNSILEIPENTTGLKVNGTALVAKGESGTVTTFGAFRKLLATVTTRDAAAMTSNGFFMTNAPLSNTAGSTTTKQDNATTKTTTLVTITSDVIYESEAAAEAGTNYAQVYVERGMAKVTMEQSSGSAMINSKMGGTADLSWQVTGWILDNTAPSSYLVRSTDGDADFRNLKTQKSGGVYRYVGNTQIKDGLGNNSGFYRTYFAKSKGYDEWVAGNTYALTHYSDVSEAFATTYGETNPKYCFENTFDVNHQTVVNTTLVQVAITAGSGADLYIVGGQKSIVYTQATLLTYIKQQYYDYLLANSKINTTKAGDDSYTLNSNTDLTVTLDESGAPTVTIATVGVASGASAYYTVDASTDLSAMQNAIGSMTKYEDGVSYYNIRIKHFGDNLTPWNSWESAFTPAITAPAAGNVSNIYPDNNSNRNGDYLGRYGVLRNNWYAISVSDVRSLGDATPRTSSWPGTPDDELDNYLAFRINVLSWAKRTQAANL